MTKEEKQSKLLKEICRRFNDNGIPAAVNIEEIGGNNYELLRVMVGDPDSDVNETLGEYYFLNDTRLSPEVMYFTGIITLKNDIEEKIIPALMEAVTRLNTHLPYGFYALQPEQRILMVRMDTLLQANGDEQFLLQELESNTVHLFQLSDMCSDALVQMCDGVLSLEQVREVLNI